MISARSGAGSRFAAKPPDPLRFRSRGSRPFAPSRSYRRLHWSSAFVEISHTRAKSTAVILPFEKASTAFRLSSGVYVRFPRFPRLRGLGRGSRPGSRSLARRRRQEHSVAVDSPCSAQKARMPRPDASYASRIASFSAAVYVAGSRRGVPAAPPGPDSAPPLRGSAPSGPGPLFPPCPAIDPSLPRAMAPPATSCQSGKSFVAPHGVMFSAGSAGSAESG